MDQAGTLRKLMDHRVKIKPANFNAAKVISVTSGKGGVGKTNVVANLAVALQKQGKKVLVLDGDFGLANLNIVMGLEPKGSIYDVINGTKDIADIVLDGPYGVKLLPSSSGIIQMANLSMTEKMLLMERLEASPIPFDILLIDTGAGIGSDVTYLNAAATEVLVVTTPEPTSITDAYALIKVLNQGHKIKKFSLIVNMVHDPREGLNVYNHLLNVTDRFLNISIEYLGAILFDRKVSQSVMSRKVLCDLHADSSVARSIDLIAKAIAVNSDQSSEITGNIQFFWRSLLQEVSI